MSLAVRFLLAFGLLAIFATALVGVPLREVARRSIEEDFVRRTDASGDGVRRGLAREVDLLQSSFPSCDDDVALDKALADLQRVNGDAHALDPGTRIGMRHYGEREAKNRRLAELYVFTSDGTILGAHDPTLVGTRDPALVALAKDAAPPKDAASPRKDGAPPPKGARAPPRVRFTARPEPSLETACLRNGDGDGISIGLVGRRRIAAGISVAGEVNGVDLHVADPASPVPPSTNAAVVTALDIKEFPGLRVIATVSRDKLNKALGDVDNTILRWGALALVVALFFGLVLGRNLSNPIVALAHETREVISGEPRPVGGKGAREIVELASAFNRTIEELASIRRRLAATERIAARREVARLVAHEIKNPLAPIRAAVETLRRLRAREDPAFDEYFEEATSTVLQEVHRIANIVTEFTKFARLPAPNLAPTDLVVVARGVVTLHNQAHGLESSKRARVDLVADDTPEIQADKDQLVQVLTNLVQNGLDAASVVRDDPRVVVTVGPLPNHRVRIVVRDNGPGVPEAMLSRLFEPYATTKEKGTGLGLAIVQRIVFEHGGEIAYREATKGGAVFEFWLPIGGPPLMEKPPGSPESTGRGITTSAAKEPVAGAGG